MSLTNSTPESLKAKAKVIRKFLNEKYNVDVSHGHCLDLISELSGFKDWNTASAALRPNVNQNDLPILIRTVGGMRKALEPFKDSAKIEASSIFAVGAALMNKDELGLNERSAFFDRYSFIVGETNDDSVSLVLKLEQQTLRALDTPEADISMDDVDFIET